MSVVGQAHLPVDDSVGGEENTSRSFHSKRELARASLDGLASKLEQRDFHPPVCLSSLRICIVGQGFSFARARNGDSPDIDGVLPHKVISDRLGTTKSKAQVYLFAASVICMSRYGCFELRPLAHFWFIR